jgi:transposase
MNQNTKPTFESVYTEILGLKDPWKIANVDFNVDKGEVIIDVEYPGGSKANCSEVGCIQECKIHDKAPTREWRHLDTCQLKTIIRCAVPRTDCPDHNIKNINVPWADKHSRFTMMFERLTIDVLLATTNIKKAQAILRLSWDQIHHIQERAVARGLKCRDLQTIIYAGIDEKSFGKGHSYASLLYDIKKGCVLEVEQGRDSDATSNLFGKIPQEQLNSIQAIAMDMWPAFMKAALDYCPLAKIVHDKFHVAKYLGKAVDDVRKKENSQFLKDGNDTLKGTKFCWLKREENMTEQQNIKFQELLSQSLKTAKAWMIKDLFDSFWNCSTDYDGVAFFKQWFFKATHSKLKPIIKVAKTLKNHLTGLLSYFEHRITNAVSEGLNSKIQFIKASARGFRNFNNYRVSILFHCGKLKLYPSTLFH